MANKSIVGETTKRVVIGQNAFDTPGSKKHIAILGGGTSGIIVAKQLIAKGHTVKGFELLTRVGGVYAKSYDSMMLTTSSCMTAWTDYSDGKEDHPVFWNDLRYLEYVDAYCQKFDLLRHFLFRTRVVKVLKDEVSGKWRVTFQRNQHVDYHRAYGDVKDLPVAPEETEEFDGVAVCTGVHHWACRPEFPGEERYEGDIIHAENYRSASDFAGKSVLIIGAGESGSDICNDISKTARATAIVARGKHGHIIPRIQKDGRVTDLNTNRCRYSNPYVLGDWVGWANQLAKRFVAGNDPNCEESAVLCKVGELNLEQGTSAFSKFGCKNEGFVQAIVKRGCKLFRTGFELQKDRAVFADGQEFQADIIVACTGYRLKFPMFEATHPEILAVCLNPRRMYKQVIIPEYKGQIAFFGFTRPAFGSVPPTVEMQSKWWALIVSGELKLPDCYTMEQLADEDRKMWESRFKYDGKRVKGLVDYQVYMDDLATQMGCLPPLWKLFFTKFSVWYKIMFGPFTGHQYIIQGPYANPQRAYDVYSRQPVGDFLETSITAAFLVTAKALSLLGFHNFDPINF